MNRATRRERILLTCLLGSLPVTAYAQVHEEDSDAAQVKVEGVNPADLPTQVQVSYEYNQIASHIDQSVFTLKYDRRLGGSAFGINVEWPAYLQLSLPGNSPDGYGDVFSRIRYVTSSGRWSYGGAFEVVWPVGSDEFSGHRYQTNAAMLAVYAWSYRNITALAHKQFVGKIEDGHLGENIRQWYLRALQIHITPTGWFYQADVTFTHDSETDEDWWDSRLSAGKQLSPVARASVELKKLAGDRKNDWALSLSYARKLAR